MARDRVLRDAVGLVSLSLSFAVAERDASAADKGEKHVCVAAYEEAQRLRFANKLLGAREKLRVCRRDVCPGLVRNDCEKWLGEVAESLPSVVLSARDPGGRDLFDVTVTLDGAPVQRGLDGAALDVDPGAHTVRFVRGADAKEERLLIRQGEHHRVIVGVLGQIPVAPSTVRTGEPSTQRVVGLVLGAGGLAALGAAGVLGLTTNGAATTLRETCGATRSCSQDEVDAVSARRAVAGVVAGIGGATLITGIVLVLTASGRATNQASQSQTTLTGQQRREGARAPTWAWSALLVPGEASFALRSAF